MMVGFVQSSILSSVLLVQLVRVRRRARLVVALVRLVGDRLAAKLVVGLLRTLLFVAIRKLGILPDHLLGRMRTFC